MTASLNMATLIWSEVRPPTQPAAAWGRQEDRTDSRQSEANCWGWRQTVGQALRDSESALVQCARLRGRTTSPLGAHYSTQVAALQDMADRHAWCATTGKSLDQRGCEFMFHVVVSQPKRAASRPVHIQLHLYFWHLGLGQWNGRAWCGGLACWLKVSGMGPVPSRACLYEFVSVFSILSAL